MQSAEFRIIKATAAEQIDAARTLFRDYASSLGWDLSDSRIVHEMELLFVPDEFRRHSVGRQLMLTAEAK